MNFDRVLFVFELDKQLMVGKKEKVKGNIY